MKLLVLLEPLDILSSIIDSDPAIGRGMGWNRDPGPGVRKIGRDDLGYEKSVTVRPGGDILDISNDLYNKVINYKL